MRACSLGVPEMAPGRYKTRGNRAGETEFVTPALVRGTLERGLERYRALTGGFDVRCSRCSWCPRFIRSPTATVVSHGCWQRRVDGRGAAATDRPDGLARGLLQALRAMSRWKSDPVDQGAGPRAGALLSARLDGVLGRRRSCGARTRSIRRLRQRRPGWSCGCRASCGERLTLASMAGGLADIAKEWAECRSPRLNRVAAACRSASRRRDPPRRRAA